MRPRPRPTLQTTTLWDFPAQNYGDKRQGDPDFAGATPSYVVWNLLQRYTQARELVVDPMCGSGTTLDVARDLERRALGYDLKPARRDIYEADARQLPLADASADFVFIDPPYGTHIRYSGRPGCIGELDAFGSEYYDAMREVFAELCRILRPGRVLAVYVGDSYVHGKGMAPIGLRLFELLRARLTPVDHIAVVRHNKTLREPAQHRAAREGNFFLRGFHHLLVLRKDRR
jgi:DNA modification methylase